MTSNETLAALITKLVAATYFEDAATATLQAMFGCVEATLSTSQSSGQVRILRGVVHLRPEGNYQRLFGIEHGGARVEGTGYLTSGNVWRWIEEHRCSVSIDVLRGVLRSWLAGGSVDHPERAAPDGLPGNETRERMLGRDATQVHVVPLRAPAGTVDGMITLEASFRVPTGRELPWAHCYEELETISSVARAFIAARALPVREAATAEVDEFLPVVGQATVHLVELLRAFAPREDTVLISGPTGSGKSRLARWCHEHSARKGQRFEHLDLLGVPEELQMAELFGWRRGAFTGAVKDSIGAVGRAGKGTLFLDEIDKLSLKAQAGLLHFIEERCYRVLGDNSLEERRAEARLLVGTNGDLRAAMRSGRFREDLYYRINVLPVRLLPLSERMDELPAWADFMLQRRHREGMGQGSVRLEPEALKVLASAAWPGNLRQLDNIVRRAYALLLAGQQLGTGDMVILRHHVDRALTFDSDSEPNALAGLLWRAARAFVEEAARRRHGGTPLTLDLVEAFRGMVLCAAVQQIGSRDEAFTLLGREPMLKNRNHHRAFRRELQRVRELLREIGSAPDPAFEELLAAAPDEDDS